MRPVRIPCVWPRADARPIARPRHGGYGCAGSVPSAQRRLSNIGSLFPFPAAIIAADEPCSKRLRTGTGCIVGEFSRAEGAALKQIADRIGPDLCLLGLGMSAVILRLAGGSIAELMGARIVPPGRRIVRRAVEDLEADIRMLQTDANQLYDILRRDPDRQPAHVERTRADIADSKAGHDHAVLVGIERAQGLAERLADAVAAVRPHRDVGGDLAFARIEADGV